MLSDFDKVFAMLDGKQKPAFGLLDVFNNHMSELWSGQRMPSDYFDVRYYPGVGTIHFFAKSKVLVDRLNKTVGRRRNWLPPAMETGAEAFWKQYEQAEKLDVEVRAEIKKLRREKSGGGYMSRWDCALREAMSEGHERNAWAKGIMGEAIANVLERHGLLDALTHEEERRLGGIGVQGQLLLAA